MAGGLLLDVGLLLAIPYIVGWLFLLVVCERWLEWRDRQGQILSRLLGRGRKPGGD